MDAAAAAAAVADADTTLDFDPAVLKHIYDYASPYIVGVAESSGVIFYSISTHDMILVHPETIADDVPDSVVYHSRSTNRTVPVDAVAILAPDVAVLFASRNGKPPLPPPIFAPLDEHDGVTQKVVSFFPSMDSVAIFKGHVVIRNAISRAMGPQAEDYEASSIDTFCFTCPYASTSSITPEEEDPFEHDMELETTRSWTLGAPVFNLSCHIVGTVSDVGTDYNIKFAKREQYLQEVLAGLRGQNVNWLKGEGILNGS